MLSDTRKRNKKFRSDRKSSKREILGVLNSVFCCLFLLFSRLSEHIALNLADNNPEIADLSDINRPTNLVEKFALLYDDQWTEAFDALQELPEYKNEEKTIELLLGFVMV